MPLSDHEQRILEEIERRLAEEDPKLDEHVGRTDLYTHLARRIRLATAGFVVGLRAALALRPEPMDRGGGVRAHGVVGAGDLSIPGSAGSRSDPRDAAGRPHVVHRHARAVGRALPSAGRAVG